LENDDKGYKNNENIEIETVFVCETCKRDFNDQALSWLHIRAMHREYAVFTCGVCLKMCFNHTQLQNHVCMYHGRSKLLISEQRRYSHLHLILFIFLHSFCEFIYHIDCNFSYSSNSASFIIKFELL